MDIEGIFRKLDLETSEKREQLTDYIIKTKKEEIDPNGFGLATHAGEKKDPNGFGLAIHSG